MSATSEAISSTKLKSRWRRVESSRERADEVSVGVGVGVVVGVEVGVEHGVGGVVVGIGMDVSRPERVMTMVVCVCFKCSPKEWCVYGIKSAFQFFSGV